MRRRDRVTVRATGAMHLVAARVVRLVSRGMAAREAEERHGGHAGGSKNDAEDVEVHYRGWRRLKIFLWLTAIYRTTILLLWSGLLLCSDVTPFS